jgi:hypothetical protein
VTPKQCKAIVKARLRAFAAEQRTLGRPIWGEVLVGAEEVITTLVERNGAKLDTWTSPRMMRAIVLVDMRGTAERLLAEHDHEATRLAGRLPHRLTVIAGGRA